MAEWVKLTYVHSSIGNNYHQKGAIRALGFRKLHQSRVVLNSPSLRGMLRNVAHLVKVEPSAPPAEPFTELPPAQE